MNNFTYRSNEEKDNLEAILRQRKRKFNKQQWVARIILAFIVISVLLYVANNVYYTTYDGYIHVDDNKVRAPFDIFLDSIYVSTGQIVVPGDTLYSYYGITELVGRADPTRQTAATSTLRDLKIKQQAAQREISVLEVQIRGLQKQIADENHNIALGLSSNSHRLDLERSLNETRAKLKAKRAEGQMYSNLISSMPEEIVSEDGAEGVTMVYDDGRSHNEGISYKICSEASIVTAIKAPNRTVLFKKEDILEKRHLDLEANNLCVIAYVPVDKMHRITLDTRAEVRVNGEFSFYARVTSLGLRTDPIPENLQSYFAKKNIALIARLTIEPEQKLPFWCFASGLPVDIRIKNIETWGKDVTEKNYLWYLTGEGVSEGFEPRGLSVLTADSIVMDSLSVGYLDADSVLIDSIE